ncbi:conserved hypothetical protein [Methanosalsum zhilinae DSM 4017]|uniref:DUF5518 domain-containing protein n=1 Tax=Methanosalsum zhilinae (strain DSM 4017 / NBRC 107636 / OCM 62 / WeN5) TaxID=679901 RepID=F7XNH0_METZD|nr:conserved hypothetical protein [Methanosalsum zhilinae DSM 4017]
MYAVPGIDFIAPLAGGFIGSYFTASNTSEGLSVGLWMTVIMIIPSIVLAFLIGTLFSGMAFIGFLGAFSVIFITLILISHIAILGTIGTVLGGWFNSRQSTN